jgi:hypothetical protein
VTCWSARLGGDLRESPYVYQQAGLLRDHRPPGNINDTHPLHDSIIINSLLYHIQSIIMYSVFAVAGVS